MGFIYYRLYPFITKNKYNWINSLQFASHSEHLHHLVPEVVDRLDGDAAVLGFVEGTAGVAVEGGLEGADATFARPNSDLHQRNLTPAFSLSALSTR